MENLKIAKLAVDVTLSLMFSLLFPKIIIIF